MGFNTKLQDAEALDIFGSALVNTESKPGIAETMAKIGYDSKTLEVGKKLLEKARKALKAYLFKKGIFRTVQNNFIAKRDALSETFELDRKKARLVCRKDSGKLDTLGVSVPPPRIYSKWILAVGNFYTVAANDQGIQEELARAKLTIDDINAGQAKIEEVLAARHELRNARGEAQSATKAKDQLFLDLRDWMKDFYQAAKITMHNDPQMMEALGKVVRS